jgi:hypothetical protein
MAFKVPEVMRLTKGDLGTTSSNGNNGVFFVPLSSTIIAVCVASDGKETDWEHVSVTLILKRLTPTQVKRCPIWDEMCKVKETFWDDEDCVIQFHSPKSHYVNLEPYCLHLWRYTKTDVLMPKMNEVFNTL